MPQPQKNPSIDLRVGSPLHKKILEALNNRFRYSASKMQGMHDKWRKAEDQFLAYIPESETDARKRAARESSGKQDYTTIVLPYTYASVMSAHSYWTSVFMARSPIFQYAGRHGESELQTSAMEALIDYQLQVGKMILPMFFWLLDPGKFGVGIIGQYWCEETRYVAENVQVPQSFLGFPTGKVKSQVQTREVRGYYGSKIFNIRPYDFYPDPRVPLWDVQSMEFVAYARDIGWNEILSRAKSGEYIEHNCEWARKSGFSGSTGRQSGSTQSELPNEVDGDLTAGADLNDTGPYAGVILHVSLIPSEWGLGDRDYPEKWVFTCLMKSSAANSTATSGRSLGVVIGARPLGSLHDKHPFFVLETEPDAYSFLPRSMAEVAEPIQRTMDWLINSHMYNVRNALNIQFLIDPAKVVMSDFKNPVSGGGIRLRPGAYGTPINQVLGQVQVQDVTAQHIGNMQYLDVFGQKALGINEQILGMVNSGGRKTATEIRSSSSFGVNRQKTITEMFSAMGFDPLSETLVQDSQQWFDAEMKLRVVGDQMQQAGPQFLNVNPDMIQGFFDFVPVDGTLPIDRFAQANLWKEILIAIPKMPQIAMQYDVSKIFAYTAQIAGLRAINKFRIQIQPDAQVAAAMQAGNLVPARAGGSNVAEPAQIPLMGPTG